MNRELLQQALYLIKSWQRGADAHDYFEIDGVITALKAELAKPINEFNPDWDQQAVLVERIRELEKELAKPEQEPVCWITPDGEGFRMRYEPPVNDVPLGWTALYEVAPRKEWVGLTDEELSHIKDYENGFWFNAKAIEAKLKEKNT